MGKATSVNWPVGLGGKGNEGVTQQVKQTEGAIGYVELIYALSNDLSYCDDEEAAGEFVDAVASSRVTAAAASAKLAKDTDFRVSITNAPGTAHTRSRRSPGCWSTRMRPTPRRGKAIHDFLAWMITPEAQQMAAELKYAPLPEPVVKLIEARLPTLKANGKSVASN